MQVFDLGGLIYHCYSRCKGGDAGVSLVPPSLSGSETWAFQARAQHPVFTFFHESHSFDP